ncbi:uncharacterized protein EAF02_004786 [Botrytis sinoallii]|uniref:uncharacterized protein n=1 Tax=Botrytis sinoallii TaxID=1463999 RepID=UPI001900B84A|nr:uncharacterized protein EAF02_004786 [Botrytis sinoallii]KAF7884450.1 hypothetical protein EAF02_004786 [Botrytis sinoallii]
MGLYTGFDMVPRLSERTEDQKSWERFIQAVKEHYQNDDLVEAKQNCIIVKVDRNLFLPSEGHKLLRFCSKISVRHAEGVEDYLDTITRIAEEHFGSRVHTWEEELKQEGFYRWVVVYDSRKYFEQLGEPNASAVIDFNVFKNNSKTGKDSKMFSIEQVPGKGKGLIARFNIEKGKRILSEKSFLEIRTTLASGAYLESNISQKSNGNFFSLQNNICKGQPFSGILVTDAIGRGNGSTIVDIYPTICLINHDCLPNTHTYWNPKTECRNVHAVRAIKSGEEITIAYRPGKGETLDVRREHLKRAYAFDCTCLLCSLSPAETQASDTQRTHLRFLRHELHKEKRMLEHPTESLADCHTSVQILKEENKDRANMLISDIYRDAFNISIAQSDQARASCFMERAYSERVLCEGEDGPDVQNMRRLIKKPSQYESFALTNKWQTGKKEVPKGLNTEEFEKWLWRDGM